MKVILIFAITLSVIHLNGSQNMRCDRKSANTFDLMIQRLYLFGATDRKYPTTQGEMQQFCGDNTKFQDWIRAYSGKCLEKLSKQVLGLMMYSITKHTNGICKSKRRTRDFLQLGACGNVAKNATIKCWESLIRAAESISNHRNNKMKIPLICCNYYVYKSCNLRAYESKPEKCNQKAIDGHEKLINAFALDTLKLLCADYTDENDKCDKIIDQTGQSDLKELPKSPIPPVIKILNSAD